MNGSLCTAQQHAAWERDGFVVIPRLFDARQVASVRSWVDELLAREPEPGALMLYLEDDLRNPGVRIPSRLEKFADAHAQLGALIDGPQLRGRAGELMGEEAVLFKEKVNFKLPGGDGFKPHQDIQPGWDAYAPFFVSVLVALDDSTVRNGCLELAPGGHHKRGWIGRPMQPLEGDELDGIDFRHYPTRAGDVAFFDCFVPHRSGPNLSDDPRRTMYLTYNRASDGDHRAQYFADKRRSFPPDNEREPGKVYAFKV